MRLVDYILMMLMIVEESVLLDCLICQSGTGMEYWHQHLLGKVCQIVVKNINLVVLVVPVVVPVVPVIIKANPPYSVLRTIIGISVSTSGSCQDIDTIKSANTLAASYHCHCWNATATATGRLTRGLVAGTGASGTSSSGTSSSDAH